MTKHKSFLLEIYTSNYYDDTEKISEFSIIFLGGWETVSNTTALI